MVLSPDFLPPVSYFKQVLGGYAAGQHVQGKHQMGEQTVNDILYRP